LDARAFDARNHGGRVANGRAEHPNADVIDKRSPLFRSDLGQPLDFFLGEWNWNLAYAHGLPFWQRTSPLVYLVYPIVLVIQRIVSGGKPIRYLG
jgi:hypothetical protein